MSYYVDNQGRVRKNFAPTRTIPVFADIDNHLDEHSENPVQNKVITKEINKIKGILGEVVIEAAEITFPYLNKSALPHSVEDKPIVFNAGMDLKGIKGRSYVVNQKVKNGDFQDTTNWNVYSSTYGSLSVSNNEAIITIVNTPEASYQIGLKQTLTNAIKPSHKYLASCIIKNGNSSANFKFEVNSNEGANISLNALEEKTLTSIIEIGNNFYEDSMLIFPNVTTAGFSYSIKNVFLVDLTQWFGSNDAIPSDLLSNPNLFLSKYYFDSLGYEEGIIRSTEPTGITTRGFNQWDENVQVGAWDYTTGVLIPYPTEICSKNKIIIKPNTTYYISGYVNGMTVVYYDINGNYISGQTPYNNEVYSPSNAYYMGFNLGSNYGTTYNHDICINISNNALNGQYKPYEEHHYPISMPPLKSAGNVQDTDKKVNIGVYYFTGDETWDFVSGDPYWRCNTENLLPESAKTWGVILSTIGVKCDIYNNNLRVYLNANPSITSSTDMATLFANTSIYYELLHPTDQEEIILPEDIKIQEGGTIELGFYESEMTPCDMTFEIAVSRLEE